MNINCGVSGWFTGEGRNCIIVHKEHKKRGVYYAVYR